MRVYRSNGLWTRMFCAGLVLAAGCASPAIKSSEQDAQVKVEPESPQQESAEPAAEQKDSKPKKHLWYHAAKEDLRK